MTLKPVDCITDVILLARIKTIVSFVLACYLKMWLTSARALFKILFARITLKGSQSRSTSMLSVGEKNVKYSMHDNVHGTTTTAPEDGLLKNLFVNRLSYHFDGVLSPFPIAHCRLRQRWPGYNATHSVGDA